MNRGQGTVKPWADFNARADCERLKKAMKGIGCDSKAVFNLLCLRSNDQRQEIRKTYKTMYGKDLIEHLVKELHGKLEDVVVALMYTPDEYDARSLRYAVKGLGTTESILIEILASRSNTEIKQIRETYTRLFKRDLEKDIADDTSYHFKRLLISLVQGQRDESSKVDPTMAKKDARALYQAGVNKLGTDESTFNAIISPQNFNQLNLVFHEYETLAKESIEKSIKNEFSGDIQEGLLACVSVARNPSAYFAERLYKSMKGLGTTDHQLIRVVVTRSEVDMVQIKTEFESKYGKTLGSFIADDTSGKYKAALLLLVKGN